MMTEEKYTFKEALQIATDVAFLLFIILMAGAVMFTAMGINGFLIALNFFMFAVIINEVYDQSFRKEREEYLYTKKLKGGNKETENGK